MIHSVDKNNRRVIIRFVNSMKHDKEQENVMNRKGTNKMRLNYKQLTYIIETLREAKCKAYDAWIDKKFEFEKAQDDANEWLENHPTTNMGDDMTISDIIGDTEDEYEKARDAYYMAEEIYRNFTEGEIEI